MTTSPSGHSPTGSGRKSHSSWFAAEVQQMMHGFGDCRKPLQESAILIEEIVHQQLASVLYQAAESANLRCSRLIGIEDFLFLLRKDKVKLRRFLRYMEVKHEKVKAMKGVLDDPEDSGEQAIEGKKPLQSARRCRKICYDFLSSIDQTGELIALFDDDSVDEVKFQRNVRADIQSRKMNPQKYKEFCEARQSSFSRRYKSQRFREWLMAGVDIDVKPNCLAMEVLSYLASETVAQVVDLALLVKKDCVARSDDPIARSMPHVYMSHDPLEFWSSRKVSMSSSPGIKMETQSVTSPRESPPSPDSTPVPPHASGSSLGGQSSSTSVSGKTRAKKRKKSGSTASLELGSTAIQPSEIREGMRRYRHTIGPFSSFAKPAALNSKDRLLCL